MQGLNGFRWIHHGNAGRPVPRVLQLTGLKQGGRRRLISWNNSAPGEKRELKYPAARWSFRNGIWSGKQSTRALRLTDAKFGDHDPWPRVSIFSHSFNWKTRVEDLNSRLHRRRRDNRKFTVYLRYFLSSSLCCVVTVDPPRRWHVQLLLCTYT